MIWKKIKGFENYEVSNTGSVRNIKTGTILSQQRKGDGRKRVILMDGEQRKNIAVDRLVADTYFNENTKNCDIIHINGNLSDNSVGNLSFTNRNQKRIKVIEHGAYYDTRKECCMAIGMSSGTLSECLNGKRKSYKGLHFTEVE